MPKIPFEQQHLPRDPIQDVEHQIAQGNGVSGADLLYAIEQSVGRMDQRLCDIILKCSIPEVKRRGRPHDPVAEMEWALEQLDRRYPALLRYEERKDRKLKSGNNLNRASPSERAYERLRNHMDIFRSLSCWESLRNMHSAWKQRRLHSMKNPVDSEDFDAEIERQFPAPKS